MWGGKTYCNLHVFHLRIDVLNFRNCCAFMSTLKEQKCVVGVAFGLILKFKRVGLCIFTGHRCLCMTPVILKQE